MVWFKVDDGFWGHPKQTALPPGPIALWVRAGSWSSSQLTDGLVPEHMVVMLGAKKRDAELLVTAGLWDKVPDGYQFHDWKVWQPSRDDVQAKRAEEAERKRKWREKRAAQRAAEAEEQEMSQGVSQRDNSVASDGTDAGVPDLSRSSRPDPTRPDPTRSSPTEKSATSGTTSKGGSHVSSGAADEPPLYPDHCPDHQVPVPPKCGGCQKQKAANKAAAERLPDYRLRVVPDLCGQCDERWIETDDGSWAKCPTCYPKERTA